MCLHISCRRTADAGRLHFTVYAECRSVKAAKEGAVVKFLFQQRRKRTRMNGIESQKKSSVTDAYLGGVAGYRCSAVAIGRCG